MPALAQNEAHSSSRVAILNTAHKLPPNMEHSYFERLDNRIRTVVGNGSAVAFSELCSLSLGAWPGLVLQRLNALGLQKYVVTSSASTGVSHCYNPELHLLASEWYFTPEAAAYLVERYMGQIDNGILLGCPTIARYLMETERKFVLLDSNEFLTSRFPDIRQFIHLTDLNATENIQDRGSTVVLDPPWYLPVILRWLSLASHAVLAGGKIVMPLLQPGTRPSALDDRGAILAFAQKIGDVSLDLDCLSFETPLFEVEALKACGAGSLPSWRRSDLLVISNVQPIKILPMLYDSVAQGSWKTYLLGPQVIKLRIGQHRKDFILRSLNADGSFVLDTVSARDKRLSKIGLWSSRNRIAEVGDEVSIALALDYLSEWQPSQSFSEKVHNRLTDILGSSKAAFDLQIFLAAAS